VNDMVCGAESWNAATKSRSIIGKVRVLSYWPRITLTSRALANTSLT